ncbi:hypothetical protein ACFE04_007271 [Oxalis oulophora]
MSSAMRSVNILLCCCIVVVVVATTTSFGANVTYDHRALVIDGERKVLISGSIHYPRSTPDMWPDLIQKSKDGGLNVIETYVFWNLHEPVKGQYNFEGRNDLVKFIKVVAAAGLYAHLRIGPYACAEWNYGGFPVWLHFVPGIKFRTDNEPFKEEMQRFTAKIVDIMQQEKLYASQGGPIILSQIENEYGNVDDKYGPAAKSYINWAASMATSLNTGVPWVMCQQADAPDPIINTCNGFYCDQFTPNSKSKPKFWTENWSGWFLTFGGAVPYRPVEDLAFSVARFFQLGGTLQNYYMYHGGTNFGRTSGGPFISTSYDYDAPLDEYGMLRQPKWGHLKDLHKAIKLCESALVATDPATTSLGQKLEATIYQSGSSTCAAFLSNWGQSDATVSFKGHSYHIPAWSVSILPDCKNVVFNTAKVNSMTVVPSFARQSLTNNVDASEAISSGWSYINEPVGISKDDAMTKLGLLEQINTTADKSDYLWYSTSIDINGDEDFLQDGLQTVLHVQSLGHAFHAFINGKLAGEDLGFSIGDSSQWVSQSSLPTLQPLIWYKSTFDAPSGNDPIALDFTGMGKGEAWVNGQSIGRYWPTYIAPNNGCSSCNYVGSYSASKCLKNCGKPSQKLYHVPRSWLKPSGNIIVLFEELGGDPTKISFSTKQSVSLCSHVSESHPSPVEMWSTDSKTEKKSEPILSLQCPSSNQVISSIKFASFGSPSGTCGTFSHGNCSSAAALSIVEKACIGSNICRVRVSTEMFGNPCKGITKSLAVEASCG